MVDDDFDGNSPQDPLSAGPGENPLDADPADEDSDLLDAEPAEMDDEDVSEGWFLLRWIMSSTYG